MIGRQQVAATPADVEAILSHLRPLLGHPAWMVRLGWGSFLTMEFGSPVWETRAGRDDECAHGEWHLWIEHAAWRIEHDGTVLAASVDDRAFLRQAVAVLDERVLRDAQVTLPALDTVFVFEGGYVLRVLPAASREYEHWMLFTPSGHVLTVGPGTTHEHAPSDAPPPDVPPADEEARVSFRVLGDAVDPVVLTRALGVTPTSSTTKGQPDPRRPHLTVRRTTWVLESPLPVECPLVDHLEALLTLLEPRRPRLRRLARGWGAYVSFLCDLSSDDTHHNSSLPADLLRRVAALGAGLDVSFWVA